MIPAYATQDPKLFTGNAMTYYGRWDYKFAEAVRHGAAGLLVIHETKAAGYPWDVPRNGANKPQFDLRIDDYASQRLALEGWITEDAASRVLSAAGMDFAALEEGCFDPRLQRQGDGRHGEHVRAQRRAQRGLLQRGGHGAREQAPG